MLSMVSLRRLVWLLCLAVSLSACKKEKKKVSIPEECTRAHKHVLALLKQKAEQEKASQKTTALKATDKAPKRWVQAWEKLQFKKLSKKQKDKKEAQILGRCAKVFARFPERVFCTLALTDVSGIKHCYDKKADLSKYKKTKKAPAKVGPKEAPKAPAKVAPKEAPKTAPAPSAKPSSAPAPTTPTPSPKAVPSQPRK